MPNKIVKKSIYDVIVIGGGPAGMMAAGRAAARGQRVLLLEKNDSLGKKLLLTGGGRCNFTNNQSSLQNFLAKYGKDSKFLFSTFSQLDVQSTINFFQDHGLATKEEAEGRMFPVSDRAQSVLDVLTDYLAQGKVKIMFNAVVKNINIKKNLVVVRLDDLSEIQASSCVVACGGVSRPDTGSSGEGFDWLKSLGHKIIINEMSLVPVVLSDYWVKNLSGVTLTDVRLTIRQYNKNQKSQTGKLLFTHFGVSGPTILNMSKQIRELLKYDKVEILIDLLPQYDHGQLKEKILSLISDDGRIKVRTMLIQLVPASLAVELLKLAEIDNDTVNHHLERDARSRLINLLKAVPLHVQGLLGADKAIVSSGGVDLSEIDWQTMQSRRHPQLFIVGDMLNIDRPSGGYSLQLCWTTGYVAGDHC
ncbi:MAG: aminoacetone oxidase family FAD-binding enzyme [Candidatus Komeilibacteria bacterium CG_4_10_14_0_2_um_filter_37_10]|uniref:Aminoacetone oxidase family FAD-binding enzyme n=1 Tax=Candidatus Komeilibacteria bacterium CG_4_10_14_0_2_um_filter_37_10 TaxID=1974470 RepID=A0A2M7VG96_9BACT|nr:MAG: aminoacetone oxidase family FAD-binding enzyme [Candidatus Komeilibacteria bacterium CG_4_10_14_0_2_um_filter_37_10]PJA94110.1 MAG: aminoacetone oxidase family FAD-binding enzyme [Candidatus Komeilibacteria bacterium CG_4_9_14_3_um_filter_37_5]